MIDKKILVVILWLVCCAFFIYSSTNAQVLPTEAPKTETSTTTTETSPPPPQRIVSILRHAVDPQDNDMLQDVELIQPPQYTKQLTTLTTKKEKLTTHTPDIPEYFVFFCNVQWDQLVYDPYYQPRQDPPPIDNYFWTQTRALDRDVSIEMATNDPKTDTYISGTIHKHRFWEPDIVAQIKKRITSPHHVFVDVGANIGYFSALAAKRGANVYSFEAVWSNYGRMIATKERNNLPQWTCIHAVADAKPNYKLHLSSTSKKRNSGNFKIVNGGMETVLTTTVDTHVKDHVNLMKINVEGHEARVLAGSTRLICYYGVRAIVIDFTQDLRNSRDCDWRKLFDWLTKIGYDLKDIRERKFYRIWKAVGWFPRDNNILFVLPPGKERAHCL